MNSRPEYSIFNSSPILHHPSSIDTKESNLSHLSNLKESKRKLDEDDDDGNEERRIMLPRRKFHPQTSVYYDTPIRRPHRRSFHWAVKSWSASLMLVLSILPLASPWIMMPVSLQQSSLLAKRSKILNSSSFSTEATTTAITKTSDVIDSSLSNQVAKTALQNIEYLASTVAISSREDKLPKNNLQTMSLNVRKNYKSKLPQNYMMRSLEEDMLRLDQWVEARPQLSPLELGLLVGSVLIAGAGPILFDRQVTELLSPTAAAFSAAIGIGAEYVGKVAVADGKEMAAATMQCAAEAEGLLANAERSKAVTPLCVGIGATSASFALLLPVLMSSLELTQNVQLMTEIYLLCPLIAIFSTAVSSLALEETRSWCRRATNIGNRRFARGGTVGRTWLSNTEQIHVKSLSSSQKWQTFATSVLPAPLMGALVPGSLPTKAIVVTALAAAQTAFYLAQSEYALSRASDAVALKSRSAAICDAYANRGARSAAILPFTSALSSLAAAATAAVVELPFLESLSGMGMLGILGQIAVVTTFPTCSALLAGAASVSKSRCEVDLEAVSQVSSTLALEYTDDGKDPVLQPLKGVMELINLSLRKSPFWNFWKRRMSNYRIVVSSGNVWKWIIRKILRQGSDSDPAILGELTDSFASL